MMGTLVPDRLQTVVTEERIPSVWEILATWSIYLIAFLAPFWFLPLTISPVDGNKLFLVSVLAIVGFIAWLGTAVYRGSIRVPYNTVLGALGVWLLAYLLSALVSQSPETSFWGSSPTAFFYLLVGGVVAFVSSALLSEISVRRVWMFLIASAIISALFAIVQTILSIDIFQWEFAKMRTFHPLGQWNTVGIFFGFVLVSVLPLLGGAFSRGVQLVLGGLFAVSLFLLVVVNFAFVWVGVGLVSAAYLAFALSRSTQEEGARKRSTAAPLLLLLVSVLFYLLQNSIGALTTTLNPPLDITPSVSSSLAVAREVLTQKPLLGVGPNLFGYAWDLYKDPQVNNTVFWRLRFGTASSFATTLLTTTGALGALAFLLFLVSVLLFAGRVLGKAALYTNESANQMLTSTVLGLLFLLYAWFVYPLMPTTYILTFLLLGLLLAQARLAGLVGQATIPIQANSPQGFVTALVIIFFMVFGVVGLYVTGQKYIAAILYGRGVALLNTEGAVNGAEHYFRRAAEFDRSRDQYLRAIAQVSFVKLQRSLQDTGGTAPEDIRNAFQLALSNAITSARAAAEVNPGDATNGRMLGQIYEAVILFVGGAADAAREAYQQAVASSPRDPVLYDDLARVSIAMGDHVKARESLEEAIRLKPDFAAAHFRLAQIAAIKGNVADAVTNAERAVLAAPNDVGILFQLGLLYYRQGNHRNAQQVLERAVALSENFSNARYFLGLTYAERGERDLAIEQFIRIMELNPDNAEVRTILTNLKEGREALFEIAPPSPLEREQPPVEEGKTQKDDLDAAETVQE